MWKLKELPRGICNNYGETCVALIWRMRLMPVALELCFLKDDREIWWTIGVDGILGSFVLTTFG